MYGQFVEGMIDYLVIRIVLLYKWVYLLKGRSQNVIYLFFNCLHIVVSFCSLIVNTSAMNLGNQKAKIVYTTKLMLNWSLSEGDFDFWHPLKGQCQEETPLLLQKLFFLHCITMMIPTGFVSAPVFSFCFFSCETSPFILLLRTRHPSGSRLERCTSS